MRATGLLRARFRRFLERPGTTIDLKPFRALLPEIEERAERLAGLSDEELAAEAAALREAAGSVDVTAVCAVGREAAIRGLGERPFDVQLIGAMAMLSGHVAEMATGEGKTLAAAITASGYALGGEPVHVFTVNDYLARRDAEWMAPVYGKLGMTVGWVTEGCTPEQRRTAYAADVTYVSVSEAGYDYLRDQLRRGSDDVVQRGLATVIVDEADSILIDEARVPLVLAGTREGEADPLHVATALVRELDPEKHYQVGEEGRSVELTADGASVVEAGLGDIDLYDSENFDTLTAVNVALYAHALLRRDVDYIVRGGKVDLVDEYRGRVAQRRRYPDGLQAAVEAKEGLPTTAEGEVLGTITVQALVGRYERTCGMTATGALVGDQLREFYKLEVAVVPSNAPCIRIDEPDRVYASRDEKEAALIAEVTAAHKERRPVLIGTLDIAESERLADALREADVPCVVLNAKNDAEEAAIIAEAGKLNAVTVSTQMAGRGIDIRLGGKEQVDRDTVADLGGLYVIGSGRHDSRRVDDQLRGRAGRQGDPGGSVFFVSVEDDLVRKHGQDALPEVRHVDRDGRVRDEAVNRAIEHAQRVAEGITFEIHRNTWRYNVVAEQQRRLYAARRDEFVDTDAAVRLLSERCGERYDEVADAIGDEVVAGIARDIALYHIDRRWADHLAFLAEVREGIHLRALGKLDPLDEFHRAAVPAFTMALEKVDDRIVETFEESEITGPDWDISEIGLIRPTATWTYMVHDNPFGTEAERFFTALAKFAVNRR